MFQIPLSALLAKDGTYRKQVSESNPFVIEYYRTDKLIWGPSRTEPNWALIIPVIIIAAILLAAIVTVCVLLYRNWRKNNYCLICFAGKTKYARKGKTIKEALTYDILGNNWIVDRHHQLTTAGFKINGLFSDSSLTKPLDVNQIVTGSVNIFPKLQK